MNNLKEIAIPDPAERHMPPLAEAPAHVKRRGLLILGMHRSGTSALTGVLGKLGCTLPVDLMGPGIGNEKGHWEAEGAVAVNDRALASAGSNWEDWVGVNQAWYNSLLFPVAVQDARTSLRTSFGTSPLFVLKDPRVCRLLPLWLNAFEGEAIDPAIVLCLRDPGEVAASLATRDGMEHFYANLLWIRHTLEAEAGTRGRNRVICNFAELRQDWFSLTTKIGQQLDLVWPRQSASARQDIEQFLTPSARSGNEPSGDAVDVIPMAHRVYTILTRWSEQGEDRADDAELDAILREFDASANVFSSVLLPGSRSLGPGGGHSIREALAQSNAAAAQAAAQSAAHLSEHERIVQDLEARLAAVQAAQAEMSGQATDYIEQIAALQSEVSALGHALAEQRNEHDESLLAHVSAVDTATHQLATVQSTLRQREEEIAQTIRERDEAREAAAQLPLLQSKLADMRAEVFHVAYERQLAQAFAGRLQRSLNDMQRRLAAEISRKGRMEEAIAALEARASKAESGLADLQRLERLLHEERAEKERLEQAIVASQARAQQAEEEVSDLRRLQPMLDQERAQKERLEKAIAVSHAKTQQAEGEVSDLRRLQPMLDQERAQKERLEKAIAVAETRLSQAEGELASLHPMLARGREEKDQLERAIFAAEAQIAKVEEQRAGLDRAHKREAEPRIEAQRIAEEHVGRLQQRLKHAETSGQFAQQQKEWLTQVLSMLSQSPRWWMLMPLSWRRQREQSLLASHGLFDARAYLELNPDVAAAGVDPLQHYLSHGLAEGRSRHR